MVDYNTLSSNGAEIWISFIGLLCACAWMFWNDWSQP
jgi:hypothetical protein